MNPHIKALGETVLRVKDLQNVKRFYVDVIGLDILREFEGITFLTVAPGYGGHTQIIGLFHESMPVPYADVRWERPGAKGHREGPFANDRREEVRLKNTSLHHFAFEIDKGDYARELERLKGLGVEFTTFEHRWCQWRSIYVKDPEGNIVELVCYDEGVKSAP
jgi:catechol-2,3-dioxygenase